MSEENAAAGKSSFLTQSRTPPAPSADSAKEKSPDGEKQSDLIGENLRRIYEDVATEPLPDRFNELLEKLRASKGSTNG